MDDANEQALYDAYFEHITVVVSNLERWMHQLESAYPDDLSDNSNLAFDLLRKNLQRFKVQLPELADKTGSHERYHSLFIARGICMGVPSMVEMISEEVNENSEIWTYLESIRSAAGYISWLGNDLMRQMQRGSTPQ
jgi:hypothetical protein